MRHTVGERYVCVYVAELEDSLRLQMVGGTAATTTGADGWKLRVVFVWPVNPVIVPLCA
jgi:hypothetical protein